MNILDIVYNGNICPNCNTDLNDKDIYEHFLKEYTEKWPYRYAKTKEQIIKSIEDYPELYKDKDINPGTDWFNSFNIIELNAWYTASSYGWTFANQKKFSRMVGIELLNGYDGVEFWHCPDCRAYWKRFEWSNMDNLKRYLGINI